MKLRIGMLGMLLLFAQAAQARDTTLHLPVEDVLQSADAQAKLDKTVKFYFAGQAHPHIVEKMGTDVSNRKTNAFNKSDEDACQISMLSALLAFQAKAKSLGANAIVDMVSYYKKDVYTSSTEYECHAGALMAGVALKGTFAKVAQ